MQHTPLVDNPAEVIDAIVIGAGLAGLIAARDLSDKGLHVVVLEGRDRLGGRTFAREVAGTTAKVDFGGTWLRPTEHTAVMAELQRYEIAIVATPAPTHFITELNGTMRDKGFLSGPEIDQIAGVYDFVAKHADHDATADRALRSVGLDDELHAWIWATERFLSGAPLTELSAVDCAHMPAKDVADPDHYTHTIDGTSQTLVDAVADSSHATVLLNTEVAAVHATVDGFAVIAKTGNRLVAHNVVVAVPLNVLADIDFGPPITTATMLGRTRHAGHSVKLWMTVRNVDAWPRIFSASGPIAYARLERRLDSEALLVGFSDDPAMANASAQDLQTALRPFLPHVEVVAVDTHDWNADHFARGTWMAPRPRQLQQISALLNPSYTKGIHFAGGDLCVDAYGTIEGAIVSGGRAAAQILAASTTSTQ